MTARPEHDWRLVPLAVAAWLGAWIGTAGLRPDGGVWFSCIASLGLGAVLFWRSRRRWAAVTVVVLVVVGLGAGLREHQLHTSLPAQWAERGAVVDALIRVVGDPRIIDRDVGPGLVVAHAVLVEMTSREEKVFTRQPVVVFASGEEGTRLAGTDPGAVVLLRAALAPADRDAPEAVVVRARSVSDPVSPPGPLDRLVNVLREGLRQAASHSPPEQAALVPSLVVGDTSAVSDELSDKFKVTSLSHLLAVSGANLTLMLVVVLSVARAVGVRGGAVRVLAVVCVGLFVVVCRNEPSVVRAAAMGLVSLSAMGLGRGRRSLRHLALAVLCLMFVDPWLSRTWGFALSVAACSGLTLLAPVWTRAMTSWLPRGVAEAVTVPLAAQLATQPLITALSGQVSVIGVLANMAAAPFVGPATVLGLLATTLVWCPPLAVATAWLAGWCVQPILWVAHLGAALPAAAWSWRADLTGVVFVMLGCAGVAVVASRLLAGPVGVLGMATVLVLASLVRPVPLGWPGPWQVVFCDVGQGDATVLRVGDGEAVVVDAGPVAAPVWACLDSVGVRRVPLLVLTHFHADHVGGAAELIAELRPEMVLISPVESPAPAASAVRAAALEAGSQVVTASAGQVIRVGDVAWTTVNAWDSPGLVTAGPGESAAENDASVVGVAEVAGLRVLLAGDTEPSGQRRALSAAGRLGIDLGVHVLKLPHHGSSRQEEGLFGATGAAVAVASAGRDNDYGHPSRAALDLARSHQMAVARTDTDGSIAVALEGDRLLMRVHGVVESG